MSPATSLKRRSFKASAWTGGVHVAGQVVRLIGNLILARFLMPEAFGLMAVISTVVLALGLLSDIGTGTLVVQSKRGLEQAFLDTAWTLQVIRGFVVWGVGVIVAGGLAVGQSAGWVEPGTVYGDTRLPLLLVVSTFGMVLWGLVSIKGKVAERQLDLRKVSLIDLGAQILTLFVVVTLAVTTRSIWALVIGGLVTATLQCIFSHLLLSGPSTRLRLEREAVRELIGKGKWVMLSSVLAFFAMNGDRLLLGGLVDSASMGLYSIAFGLATIAPSALSNVFARVMYPAFSEVVRDRPQDLARTYRKFQQVTDLLLGLGAGLLFVSSDAVIALLYDSRYHAAGPIFGVLAIGSLGVRILVVEQIYVAMGRTSLLAAAILPRVLVLLIGLPLGHAVWGMDGALAAIVLSQFAHWPLALWFRVQHKLTDWRNDAVLPAAIAVGAVGGWLLTLVIGWIKGYGA
jgi:O-antigen/teichoic acid export membrane protein